MIKIIDLNDLIFINFILMLIIYIILRYVIKNNVCLMNNTKLCNDYNTMNYYKDKLYSCKNSKIKLSKYANYYYYINLSLIIIFFYINVSLGKILLNNINLFNKIHLITNVIFFLIIIILLIIWFFLNKYCNTSNYECKLDVKIADSKSVLSPSVRNKYNDYKVIDIKCINSYKNSIYPIINSLFNTISFYILILIIIIIIFINIDKLFDFI
jgi:hypothetical protein